MSVVYTFNKELPFCFYGKAINLQNLYIYVGKVLRKENTKGEGVFVDALVNGKLLGYYKLYIVITKRANDEIYVLLESIEFRVANKTNHYDNKLKHILKFLDILCNIDKYLIPFDVKEDHSIKINFIANNFEFIIKDKELKEITNKYFIPEVVSRILSNGQSSQYIETVKFLEKIKENNLLITLYQYDELSHKYIISEMLNKVNNILLKKEEYSELSHKYFIPEKIKEGLNSGDFLQYEESARHLKKLYKNNLLLEKEEYSELSHKYFIPEKIKEGLNFIPEKIKEGLNFIPEKIKEGLNSEQFSQYENSVESLREIQHNNLLISKEEYEKESINKYIIPEEVRRDASLEKIQKLQEDNLLVTKKEYDELTRKYFIPEGTKEGLNSEHFSQYKESAKFLKEIQDSNLLLTQEEYDELTRKYYLPKELKRGIGSGQFSEYEKSVKKLRHLQKDNVLITRKEYKVLTTEYNIPLVIKRGIISGQFPQYEKSVKELRHFKKSDHLKIKEENETSFSNDLDIILRVFFGALVGIFFGVIAVSFFLTGNIFLILAGIFIGYLGYSIIKNHFL